MFIRHFRKLSMTLVIVLMVCVASATAQRLRPPRMYTAYAEDSLQMAVWVTGSISDPAAPIALMLPMMGHTHESYDLLRDSIVSREESYPGPGCTLGAPHFVSYDLRGHGRSTIRGKDTLGFRTMTMSEFAKYPQDVKRAIDSVWPQVTKSGGGHYVIGASVGANTAMMVSELLPSVSKVVLLSPGEDYRGLQPAEALKKFKGDILIFASEADKYSAASSRKLAAMNEENCTLHIFKGSDHGTDIINNNPEAMRILVDWLCAPCNEL